MNELVENRTLDVVAAEIRTLTCSMLNNVIEIGRRMVEAKEMVPYGEWGTWVEENTGYKKSTAHNFIRLYEEYGSAQGSLFGATVDVQTFGKLSYSKALALLAVPADEREKFAEENHVEDLSTRELKQAIKERDEAKRALEDELAASEGAALRISELEEKAAEARQAAARAMQEAEAARDALKELQDNPPAPEIVRELDEEELARLVAGLRDEERAKLNDELEAGTEKLKKAKAKAKEAEAKLADAEKRAQEAEDAREAAELAASENAAAAGRADNLAKHAADLEKQLAMADPVTAEFRGVFEGAAAAVQKLVELVEKAPDDVQPNLRAALTALAKQLEGQK